MTAGQGSVGGGIGTETVWQLELPEIRVGVDAVLDLPEQLRRIGVQDGADGLLVTDETVLGLGHADRVRDALGDDFGVTVYSEVAREPAVSDLQRCVEAIRETATEYGFVLGLGGGSAIDTAKAARAVAVAGGDVGRYVDEPFGPGDPFSGEPAPLVAIPTTGGSPAQISPVVAVRSDDGHKAVLSDRRIRPEATVADPTFSVTLPPDVTAATAMDALSPALESYTAKPFDAMARDPDPAARLGPTGRSTLTDALAEEAIRLLVDDVRTVVHNGDDLAARANVMLGTLYASIAGRSAGVHLGHATGYGVQEQYHTDHAVSVGVMAPASVLGFNAASDPERFARIAEFFGADTDGLGTREAADAAKREFVRYQRDLGAFPSGLAELVDVGGSEEELEALADRTLEQQRLVRMNPRPVTRDDLVAVFRDALHNWE